jgi:hypothetical protein
MQGMQAATLGPNINVTVMADFDGSQREAGFETGTTTDTDRARLRV